MNRQERRAAQRGQRGSKAQAGAGVRPTASIDSVQLAQKALAAGDHAKAERLARALLREQTTLPAARLVLAGALHASGRFDEAALEARRTVTALPEEPAAHILLGRVLLAQDRVVEAVAAFERAVEIAPENAFAHQALGAASLDAGLLGRGADQFQRVVELVPSDPAGHLSLGAAYLMMGEFAAALQSLTRARSLPDAPAAACWNQSLALLGLGRLEEAWPLYEAGFEAETRLPRRHLPIPRWRGEDLRGRTVLVWREQGLGDELKFASCYQELVERADRVIIEATPKLVPVLQRSFPEATVRADTSPSDEPDLGGVDLHTPAGAVPRYLRPSLAAFPGRRGFLTADEARRAEFRARLEPLGGGLRVGIAWRSMNLATSRLLHYATLDELRPIFEVPGCVFVNVQYGSTDMLASELDGLQQRTGTRVHRWDDVDYTDDLEAVAALTAELDVVIGPANFSVMLAGALGVSAFAFSAKHPWLHGCDEDPWFPGTRHVGRRWDLPWGPLAAELATSLRAMVDTMESTGCRERRDTVAMAHR